MPQFDLIIYFTAAKDVLIAFFIIFFLVETYFIEKLGLAEKIRQKLKKHLTHEKSKENLKEINNKAKITKLYENSVAFAKFSGAITALLTLILEDSDDNTE